MADALVLTGDGVTVEVERPVPPVFEVAPPAVGAVLVLPVLGPQGVPGTGVEGRSGQPRFTGHGAPPDVIPGAEPGDAYLDLSTGTIYTLT